MPAHQVKKLSRRQLVAVTVSFVTVSMYLGPSVLAAELSAGELAAPEEAKVRIAVVQQETVPGAVEVNRAKALTYAAEAIRNQADIVLFHEALAVGYVDNIHELAEPVDGPTTRAFQELLQGTKALVLYGLIERQGGDYYTSATLVGAAGVVANYRKTHLWWKAKGVRHEPSFFRPGKELVTFDAKGFKSGVMICYDGDFPEMTRAYANRECVMLFWLNNRGSRDHREVHPLVRANTIIMATSCCSGKNEAGHACRGGSNIMDKDGSVLGEIVGKEGIIYADVDPSAVLEARQRNPWFRGQRPDLYR